MKKSAVEEIRQRFDADVERFANLETGQSATVDAPLAMDLIVAAAAAVTPAAMHVLDIGCGAGNYTLKLLQLLPELNITLVDLSRPMLNRALQRISEATTANVSTIQADIRKVRLGEARYDIILAAAVFHHLRTDAEWRDVFAKCYAALRPGGSLWITDLIEHAHSAIQALMWARYGAYLAGLKDEAYRDHVFATSKKKTPHGRCCTRSICYTASASARSKSCTRVAASPPSARSNS